MDYTREPISLFALEDFVLECKKIDTFDAVFNAGDLFLNRDQYIVATIRDGTTIYYCLFSHTFSGESFYDSDINTEMSVDCDASREQRTMILAQDFCHKVLVIAFWLLTKSLCLKS
jgi:hypothetical protein